MTQTSAHTSPHRRFADLMASEGDYMTRVCACLHPGDRERQEEMMQAVSADFYDVVCRMEGGMSPAYARGVWQNLCKKHFNRTQRHLRRMVPLEGEVPAATEEEPLYLRLNTLLERLDDREREVIDLYAHCSTMQEMAEEMGVSVGAAKVKVHRIVKKLRLWKNEIND